MLSNIISKFIKILNREEAENAYELHTVGVAGAYAMFKSSGANYTVNQVTQFDPIYTGSGGSDDYAYGVMKIPIVFTMELPKGGPNGFDPYNISAIAAESWVGIKAMALKVAELYN